MGDGRAFGLKVTYSHERTILGTGGGPRKVRAFFGDAPFLIVNGDVVFDFDLTALVRRHRSSGAPATLALKPNPDPRTYNAVVTDSRGRVLSLRGQPRRRRGTTSLFAGVHVVDPWLLDRLPRGASDTVQDLYVPLITEGRPPLGVRVKGPWYDLGSPSPYLASQLSLLASGFAGKRGSALVDGTARVHPRARVVRSVIGAGSVVGEGAEVRDSVLWDRVRVGDEAVVDGCILATGVRIEDGEGVASSLVMRGQPITALAR